MPTFSGPDLQTLLRQRGVGAPILFLTGQSDVATAVEVMKHGAADLIEKPVSATQLLDRIRRAIDGDAKDARRRDARDAILARWHLLSSRERDVFERISRGDANKRVAIDLGISERTVEAHRSKVMLKMSAPSLPELVLMYSIFREEPPGLMPA